MPMANSAQAAADWKQQFARVSDEYFDQVYFRYAPTQGTQAGFHQYDARLEDYSRKAVDAEIAALESFEQRIEAIHPDDSPADFIPRSDREIVLANIRSQLLTLETIRPWEKDADTYSSACANAAFVLMERRFAPPNERLRSLIAREKQMPALLGAARENLKNPPHIYTEIAIEQLPGIVSFFEHDVPQAFADADDPTLKAEFAKTNAATIAALNDYLEVAEERSAGTVERRLPHRRGDLPEEAALRRDGRSAAGQAARDRLGRPAQKPGALPAGGGGTGAGQGPARGAGRSGQGPSAA